MFRERNVFRVFRNVLVTTIHHFGHQKPLSFYISIRLMLHSKDVTNIEIQSPKSTNRHQLKVTKTTVASVSRVFFGGAKAQSSENSVVNS